MSKETRAKDPNALPVGKFFAWKSRDVSLSAINAIILGYMTLFRTDYLGMNAAVVGTLMMVSKVFDGISDLFIGFIIDNTHTRFGKARPYEFAIIAEWICTVLLFSGSAEWSGTVKVIWVFCMCGLFNKVALKRLVWH